MFFEVFDLWANLPTGVLHGNIHSPGHFTECVEFRHDDIQGQHCMITSTVNFIEDFVNLTKTKLILRENNYLSVQPAHYRPACQKASNHEKCIHRFFILQGNQKFNFMLEIVNEVDRWKNKTIVKSKKCF